MKTTGMLFCFLGFIGCQTPEKDLDWYDASLEVPSSFVSKGEALKKEEKKARDLLLKEWGLEKDIKTHPEVKKWIECYTTKMRNSFQIFLKRGASQKPIIMKILRDHDVPVVFFYLALVESGFDHKARSHKAACGTWQFVSGTAKRYGLLVTPYVDERWDVLRSTVAAAHYLTGLKEIFNSWMLAAAAYNTGEGRIMNAIMKHRNRDYWLLSEKKAIHKDTQAYVPQFLAAMMVGTQAKDYGFKEYDHLTWPELKSVMVPSPVRLIDVATILGCPLEEILSYNAHLVQKITPPHLAHYRLWIPKHLNTSKLSNLKPIVIKSLPINKSLKKSVKKKSLKTLVKPKEKRYKVQKGDSLMGIAKKQKMSLKTLMGLNKMSKKSKIYPGQKLIIQR